MAKPKKTRKILKKKIISVKPRMPKKNICEFC